MAVLSACGSSDEDSGAPWAGSGLSQAQDPITESDGGTADDVETTGAIPGNQLCGLIVSDRECEIGDDPLDLDGLECDGRCGRVFSGSCYADCIRDCRTGDLRYEVGCLD